MINDNDGIDYRYQPWEVVHQKEPKNKRFVLATDIYAFACIAWRILISIGSKDRSLRHLVRVRLFRRLHLRMCMFGNQIKAIHRTSVSKSNRKDD